ncbi:hypothetical protein jhhlp_006600 [Lomentospora prolificans]|uniref:LPXTG-domain-containing protein n=1 Tax=Lomentospora prolificans TaxID=41688 RepID=A0A2N3N6D7_9PEZI|nr:hypothetical protein jhhlp_006600 [Lomentospora prolificans]
MALTLHALFYFLLLLQWDTVAAFKVTDGSPCASLCAEDSEAPVANSTVANKGPKVPKCMGCLEESEFVNGEENDQMWFLCLHNASGVGSSPCQTTTSCGALENSMLQEGRSQYSYCESGDRTIIPSDEFSSCLSCVKTGGSHGYLTNFLIALEAGCDQKPTAGQKLALNDTVFTDTVITRQETTRSEPEDENTSLPPTTIAAIAVSIVVALLLFAGCGFILWRRKSKRQEGKREMAFTKGWVKKTKIGNLGGRNTASSLDFRCRTRVTPLASRFDFRGVGLEDDDVPQVRSPAMANIDEKDELRSHEEEQRRLEEEQRLYFVHPGDALGSNPVLAAPPSIHSSPHSQYPSPPPQQPLPAPPAAKPLQLRPVAGPTSSSRPPYTPPAPRMGSLNVITTPTSTPPQFPRSTHSSPLQRHSPSAHSTATPTSAGSHAPLLGSKPFFIPSAPRATSASNSPSEAMGPVVRWLQEQRVGRDSRGGSIRERYQDDERTATSRSGASPQSTNWSPVDRTGGFQKPVQQQREEYEDPGKQWDISNFSRHRAHHSRSNARLMGAPTESRVLPTTFPPPPGR